MMDPKFFITIFTITLFFPVSMMCKAATLSLDLDTDTPGIQSTRTINPGSLLEFEVVFSGDGTTRFDTFALDVVYSSPQVALNSPTAGPIVDTAPLMALDLYGANTLSSGDTLTQGNLPSPVGFAGGLGGVGAASLGGMPFPLLGQNETVGLFSGHLTTQTSSILALTGYPFGVGAELALGGETVPVTLQGASVNLVPLPAAGWLFATGVLTILGGMYRRRSNEQR
jgi:hypothetical protein